MKNIQSELKHLMRKQGVSIKEFIDIMISDKLQAAMVDDEKAFAKYAESFTELRELINSDDELRNALEKRLGSNEVADNERDIQISEIAGKLKEFLKSYEELKISMGIDSDELGTIFHDALFNDTLESEAL